MDGLLCPHCYTAIMIKAGRNPTEKQRYSCKTQVGLQNYDAKWFRE